MLFWCARFLVLWLLLLFFLFYLSISDSISSFEATISLAFFFFVVASVVTLQFFSRLSKLICGVSQKNSPRLYMYVHVHIQLHISDSLLNNFLTPLFSVLDWLPLPYKPLSACRGLWNTFITVYTPVLNNSDRQHKTKKKKKHHYIVCKRGGVSLYYCL